MDLKPFDKRAAMFSAALSALAKHGIPLDIQNVLLQGHRKLDIAPGALAAAINAAYDVAFPNSQAEEIKQIARKHPVLFCIHLIWRLPLYAFIFCELMIANGLRKLKIRR